MINVVHDDVLNVPFGIIVHGVNDRAIMGAGIALQIKNRFPEAYNAYIEYHKVHGLKLGEISYAEVSKDKYIINAVTQTLDQKPRNVNYEAVTTCFEMVAFFHQTLKNDAGIDLEVVFPAIGAGLGGGNWKIMEAIIENTLPDTIKKTLYIYT